MANILEFLRRVLTDDATQQAYRADPVGYLHATGFAELTGEDVAEGIGVLRNVLTPEAAEALAPFASRETLPTVRPEPGEAGIHAAARLLSFAVDRLPSTAPPAAATDPAQPEAPAEEQPGLIVFGSAPSDAAASPDRPDGFDRADDHSGAGSANGRGYEILAPATLDLTALPSVAAFAESLGRSAADARRRYDESLRQFAEMSTRHAQEVAEQLTALLQQAHEELNEMRSANDAEIAQLRAEALADRDARRAALETSEAEGRAALESARREAEAILTAARGEAETTRRELDARRSELREAEEQLKERLSGIDSLFRRVLDGEPAEPAAGSPGTAGPS